MLSTVIPPDTAESVATGYLKNSERTAVEQMSTPLPAMAVKIPSKITIEPSLTQERAFGELLTPFLPNPLTSTN